MSSLPWLTVILPGSGAALAQAAQAPAGDEALATLARAAGRGKLSCAWNRGDARDSDLRPWQRGLLATLELSAAFPSAPVSARGAQLRDGFWLQLELVHFAAGLDRLTYLPLQGAAAVEEQERAAIAPLVVSHLRSCGLELHALENGEWGARGERALALETSSPDAATASELDLAMPRGPDAGELRRLMTELQMLLHDHPVNQARARRGMPAINAVWFWGAGQSSSARTSRALPPAHGDSHYLRGIYAQHDQSVSASPANGAALIADLATTSRAVAVARVADAVELETQWVAPLVQALSSRKMSRLDLVLDSWLLQLDRAALRRFWRKALPPVEWVA